MEKDKENLTKSLIEKEGMIRLGLRGLEIYIDSKWEPINIYANEEDYEKYKNGKRGQK